MEIEEKCIELRVAYPGSIVSALSRANLAGVFSKYENQFERRYERLPGGREQHVHLLPNWDMSYEVSEVVNGERVIWYCATLEGDNNIYRISEYGAKVNARREMSLRDVVREFPERPNLADFKDEDD
jgi:hypothetical protein